MPVELILHNAKLYVKGQIMEAGLAIENGKIVKIAKETQLPQASKKINLHGHLVLPGLIDAHVHLRDQKLAYKEDFYTGTTAAAAGGVTLVIDMPNNEPITMDSAALKKRMKLAENRIVCNVAFFSAFPKNLAKISEIVELGAVAFKLYLIRQIGGINIDNDEALLEAFKEAKENNALVAVHAEDKAYVETIQKSLKRKGQRDIDAFLEAHSVFAEKIAVERVLRLVEKTRAHVHFCHVSSKEGLEIIVKAKEAGFPITCEVTPHHLFLSANYLKKHGLKFLTDPPLREEKDVEALWNALKLGQIDIIASDHAPHTIEEKNADSVWDVKTGVAGLETTLPLLLTSVNEGKLSLQEMIRLTAEKPAEIFRLKGRGRLEEESYADLVVVDMHKEHVIDASKFHSKAKFSPFDGWKVRGEPLKTFVNGELVMDEGEIVAEPGTGKVVFASR
jgi:dihydroorotase